MSGWRCVGIVDRQRLVDQLRPRAGQLQHQLGQFQDRELLGIAEVHRPDEIVRAVHHADHAFDQVVAVAEGAGLRAVAEDRDVLAGQRLADEVRHHAAVVGVHARAVGVEDPHDADVDAVLAVVVHEEGFGRPLAFVVAGPRTDRVDHAAVGLGLGMDLRVAVDLAGRGLQDLRPAALGHAQHVDRPHHRGLHGLDGVVLVVARRGGTGQVVDLVDLQEDRQGDVVADQLEVGPAKQVGDVRLLAGEEVVQADDVVPPLQQPLAEMRAEKAGPAGHQDSSDHRHVPDSFNVAGTPVLPTCAAIRSYGRHTAVPATSRHWQSYHKAAAISQRLHCCAETSADLPMMTCRTTAVDSVDFRR